MPFVAECPSCGQKLKVPDNLAGKKVRCSKCANSFLAETITADAPIPAPPPRPRDDGEFASDEPMERAPRDFGGGRPGRGGMLLTFGIISIVSGVLSCVSSAIIFCFPFNSICGSIFFLVGLVMGILAWVMASGDLKKINAGVISQSAAGNTKIGMITGIIGTVINLLLILCTCLFTILVFADVLTAPKRKGFNSLPNTTQQPTVKVTERVPAWLNVSDR